MARTTVLLILVSTLLSLWHWDAILDEIAAHHCGDLRLNETLTLVVEETEWNVTITNSTNFTSDAANETVLPNSNSTEETEPPALPKRMDVQLAVTGSVAIASNAMRLLTTSINGWHQDFEDVQIYTFDPVHENSPFYKVITPIQPLFRKEKIKRNNNLLLAAIKEVYHHNPNAEWYFLAEDDSIIIKENLLYAIETWQLNSSEYVMAGKSVNLGTNKDYNLPEHIKNIPFVVGGAGVLLSHALTKDMAPLMDTCREKYNNVFYGDARIGACQIGELNLTEEAHIQPRFIARLFTNGDAIGHIDELGSKKKQRNMQFAPHKYDRPVSLHEKEPELIKVLQDWIRESVQSNRIMTWKAMKDSGLHKALNKTKNDLEASR